MFCLEREHRISSFGFQRKKDFLFSVKTPRGGLAFSLSHLLLHTDPEYSHKTFASGTPHGLVALGICAILMIPYSRLGFWFEFYLFAVKKNNLPYMLWKINTFIKVVAVKKIKILSVCSINYKFTSLFSYGWIIKILSFLPLSSTVLTSSTSKTDCFVISHFVFIS